MKSYNFSNILKWAVLVFCIAHSTDSGESECSCTGGYFPVCGSNYVTYDNRCELYCAQGKEPDLEILYPGRCKNAYREKSCPAPAYSEALLTGQSSASGSECPSEEYDRHDDSVIYFYEYV